MPEKNIKKEEKNKDNIKIDVENSRKAVLEAINEIDEKEEKITEIKEKKTILYSESSPKDLQEDKIASAPDTSNKEIDSEGVKKLDRLLDPEKNEDIKIDKIDEKKPDKIIKEEKKEVDIVKNPKISIKIKQILEPEKNATNTLDKYIKKEVKREEKEEKKKKKKKVKKKTSKRKIKKKTVSKPKNKINYLSIIKKILLKIFLVILILIIIFFVYVFLIIKFKIDTTLTRKMNYLFPIPAVITKNGYISYYDYLDKVINNPSSFDEDSMLNQIIILNLAKKYKIDLDSPDLIEQVNKNIIRDESINSVGLQRIKKIQNMINEEGSFIKVSSKYGDDRGKLDINKSNINEISFANEVMNLQINEISDIVYTQKGYYIFQCLEKNNEELFLSYVFVKNKDLNEYINMAVNEYKIWNLID